MAISDVFPALFDNYFIKIVFLIHATLVPFALIFAYQTQATMVNLSYNILFLLSVLLAILVDKSVDIILTAAAFNVVCIVLDVILLLVSYNLGTVTILLLVVNLVARPASTILLLRNYSARAGVEDPTSGLLEVSVHNSVEARPRSAYQNIDEPNQTLP